MASREPVTERDLADAAIIPTLEALGIDAARLRGVLDSGDNWGSLVPFEVVTVLSVVADAMGVQ